jgi:hypothetical protein
MRRQHSGNSVMALAPRGLLVIVALTTSIGALSSGIHSTSGKRHMQPKSSRMRKKQALELRIAKILNSSPRWSHTRCSCEFEQVASFEHNQTAAPSSPTPTECARAIAFAVLEHGSSFESTWGRSHELFRRESSSSHYWCKCVPRGKQVFRLSRSGQLLA